MSCSWPRQTSGTYTKTHWLAREVHAFAKHIQRCPSIVNIPSIRVFKNNSLLPKSTFLWRTHPGLGWCPPTPSGLALGNPPALWALGDLTGLGTTLLACGAHLIDLLVIQRPAEAALHQSTMRLAAHGVGVSDPKAPVLVGNARPLTTLSGLGFPKWFGKPYKKGLKKPDERKNKHIRHIQHSFDQQSVCSSVASPDR